ncbi:MAG: aldose epimerase [Anaerolineae bacterium]|nr:aldose epimerase [Anaerolineae bacterium]
MTTLLRMENAYWQVGILPETGGAIAYARVRHGDRWLDFMRPTAEADYGKVSLTASFPLVPWSNRLRDARFSFLGNTYQLEPTSKDGTAIHGVGRYHAWQVERASSTEIVLNLTSRTLEKVNFPFAFTSRLIYSLVDRSFVLDTAVRNESESAFPAGFGHHPYFQRVLLDPSDAVALELPYTHYFELEDDLAYRAPILRPERLDFNELRPLGDQVYDDCLTGHLPGKAIRFVYPTSGTAIDFGADEQFVCAILYAPEGKSFFAVEPVTNTNDGFNLFDQGVPGTGVFILQPGELRMGQMWFEQKA